MCLENSLIENHAFTTTHKQAEILLLVSGVTTHKQADILLLVSGVTDELRRPARLATGTTCRGPTTCVTMIHHSEKSG